MNPTGVKPLRVLLLGRAEIDEEGCGLLGLHADIDRVSAFEDALEALHSRRYDLIVCRPTDLPPFAGGHADRAVPTFVGTLVEHATQGICVISKTGELDWANSRMLQFPQEVRARVGRLGAEMLTSLDSGSPAAPAEHRARRLSFTTADGRRVEVLATPVLDLHQHVTEVAAVVWDATHAGRLQEKIDAIDKAGRELLSLDAAQFSRLDSQQRLALLEQKILRCTRDLLHFDNFEIRVLDRKTNRLDLVLCAGLEPQSADDELYAAADGNGICGYVAARGRSYICPDTHNDPRYRPGIQNARSSLTVPLWLHDRVVGVANFESTQLAAFTEDDRQFAEIFGRYVALALHLLEVLASERRTTTGQLGSNVMAEITGPLNDILTQVENLVEDYIGHDDLRHRLRAISANAVRIREIVKEITSARSVLRGVPARTPLQADPVLSGKRVLVADDEEVLRETVRDVLTSYGCQVCTAAEGATAVDLLTREKFDLVLSDIRMPHKSGYEVFAAAKTADPDTPVILTTGFGYDPNHSIIRARREGLSSVLFKPFKVDQLLTEIRAALCPAES